MISLIDGDSMIFMLGYVNREHQNKHEMHESINVFLENLFITTGANQYYGAIAGPKKCFRYSLYKVKPYKGKRPEPPEYMNFWRPICTEYLQKQYGFDMPEHTYEADDLIATASTQLKADGHETIICSPDKDLKTIPGLHYDYQKNQFHTVDESQAAYNFYKLMIEGDETDNIAGIPGYGIKKVKEKLDPLLESRAPLSSYVETVKSLYHRHFGEYYGDLIFAETARTIELVIDETREIKVHSVPQKAHPFEM